MHQNLLFIETDINRKDLKDFAANALGWVDEPKSGPEMICCFDEFDYSDA